MVIEVHIGFKLILKILVLILVWLFVCLLGHLHRKTNNCPYWDFSFMSKQMLGESSKSFQFSPCQWFTRCPKKYGSWRSHRTGIISKEVFLFSCPMAIQLLESVSRFTTSMARQLFFMFYKIFLQVCSQTVLFETSTHLSLVWFKWFHTSFSWHSMANLEIELIFPVYWC